MAKASLNKAMEKVKIRITPKEEYPDYQTEIVVYNFKTYQIPVGEEVEVPKPVARLLKRKGVI